MIKSAMPIFLAFLAGCASAPVDTPIGLPERPVLQFTPEHQADIKPETLAIIRGDYLVLKQHIIKLEGRILRHDESL